MKCQICNSNSRKVRFISNRLVICQWCVSELSQNTLNVKIVVSEFVRTIESYVDSQFTQSKIQTIRNAAIAHLGFKSEPKFLDRIFSRSMSKKFDSMLERKMSELTTKQRENEINDLTEKLLMHSDSRPMVTSYTNYNTGSVRHSELVKRSHIKIVNAFSAGLLSTSGKEARPSAETWHKIREQILSDDAYRCRICGRYGGEKHVHHIIPLSKYGTNQSANLITLCFSCHDKQHVEFKLTRNYT